MSISTRHGFKLSYLALASVLFLTSCVSSEEEVSSPSRPIDPVGPIVSEDVSEEAHEVGVIEVDELPNWDPEEFQPSPGVQTPELPPSEDFESWDDVEPSSTNFELDRIIQAVENYFNADFGSFESKVAGLQAGDQHIDFLLGDHYPFNKTRFYVEVSSATFLSNETCLNMETLTQVSVPAPCASVSGIVRDREIETNQLPVDLVVFRSGTSYIISYESWCHLVYQTSEFTPCYGY